MLSMSLTGTQYMHKVMHKWVVFYVENGVTRPAQIYHKVNDTTFYARWDNDMKVTLYLKDEGKLWEYVK